jgi:hypothetical protein
MPDESDPFEGIRGFLRPSQSEEDRKATTDALGNFLESAGLEIVDQLYVLFGLLIARLMILSERIDSKLIATSPDSPNIPVQQTFNEFLVACELFANRAYGVPLGALQIGGPRRA